MTGKDRIASTSVPVDTLAKAEAGSQAIEKRLAVKLIAENKKLREQLDKRNREVAQLKSKLQKAENK